ncbi:MAG: NADH:flavin oxidoreductase [Desulfarculaceae bacterium]|nr:NADH:flavin oxidoreductase [Desulfarculaceae bacterium]MCF8046915.1 NADH:flavin oxidoreductase [Desulfarculaceae bacterium]MCF8063894.1 NADH:flavin oxidoreductase [Desulfarculaceae bacterium]MCF8121197.1 NADH:flavin oxidoreductase [Desulfarculaceae bacterium]
MGQLSRPLDVGGMQISNRFLRSATMENMAGANGQVRRDLLRLYHELAVGGCGLIITGATAITADGRAWAQQLGAWDDAQVEGLSRLARLIHRSNPTARCAVQLHHVGSAGGGYSYGSLTQGFDLNRAADADITELARAFGRAAERVQRAGFDAVAVHGAHGYLVSQFFSPVFNQRQDGWGGSRENRGRFPLLVQEVIRREVGPDFPVLWKMNTDDFLPEGAGREDYLWLAGLLAQAGAALIELSGGVKEQAKLRNQLRREAGEREAYFLPVLEAFRSAVGDTPLALTGGMRSREVMEGVLAAGADMVGLSRPLICEPDFPNRLLNGPDRRRSRCTSCNRCLLSVASEPLTCMEFDPFEKVIRDI